MPRANSLSRVHGLHKQRATPAGAWPDVLRESEFALGIALDASEILRTLLSGLEERYRGPGLRLAVGTIHDGAVNRGVGERGEEKEERGVFHAAPPIALPHSPQNFSGLSKVAPQEGHEFGFGFVIGGAVCCPAIPALMRSVS